MATEKSLKIPKKYQCELCNLITSSLKDYNRHISTLKHQKRHLATNGNHLATQKIPNAIYQCDKCKKNYCDKSGLWKHKKKCIVADKTDDFVIDKELVLQVLKQNNDLQTQLMETQTQVIELLKKGTHNTTNSHNNTFNLQLFLHLFTFQTPIIYKSIL